MKLWFSAILVVLGGSGLLAVACASHDDGVGSPDADTANDDAGGSDAASPATDAGDDGAVAAPQTYLRIAHLSPDLPPIDVCVAPHGTTTFQGPLIGQLAGSVEDAGAAAPGLVYAQVSAYLPLAPGQYDVRIVPAGALSCSSVATLIHPLGESDGGDPDGDLSDAEPGDTGATDAAALDASLDATIDAGLGDDAATKSSAPPAVPDATNLPALVLNTYATLLLAGDLTPAGSDEGLTMKVISDDAVVAGGAAVLRAVNAVPSSPALDFGLGSSATATATAAQWVALLTSVAFAAASAQVGPGEGAVNSNGYLPIAPMAGQAMSCRASGDAAVDTAVANDVEIDVGAIATVIAIGGKTGDSARPPALLLCMDNQPSGGLLSDCSVAQ